VVLPSDLAEMLGLSAILLHVLLAGVAEDLGSHWTSPDLGQLTHLGDVALHGICAIKVLLEEQIMDQ